MNTASIYAAVEAENWSQARTLLQVELEPHTHKFKVQFAVNCARSVLHVFEEKRPEDKRPRMAIEAVEKWIEDPSEENRKAAASWAANTAWATSWAANAAYAANAAWAAANAAYAAYAASSAAASRKTKWQELIHMYEQMVRKEKLSHLCSVA